MPHFPRLRGYRAARHAITFALLALLIPALAAAAYPAKGTVLFPGIAGPALQDSLRLHYRPPQTWGYDTARDTMYAHIDNVNGIVTCIYTGFTVPVSRNSTTPRADAFQNNAGINAEHTWPQSKGAENLPMMADLHHLFPSEIRANADRGNLPYGEIPDNLTDTWYILKQRVSTPEPDEIDQYSELDTSYPGTPYAGRWEPKESMKGDLARAHFYFWTVYRAEAQAADPNFFNVEKNDLRAWARIDTVDAVEFRRNELIAPREGNTINPFIVDPTLIDRAYFNDVPVTLVYFLVDRSDDGVRLRWETSAEVDHAGFNVVRKEVAGDEGAGGDGGTADSSPAAESRLNDRLLTARSPATFMDTAGRPGALYDYWLEAVGRDGSVERYGPKRARFPQAAPRVAVWPNPVRVGQALHVRVTGAPASGLAATLFDINGRAVRNWSATTDGAGADLIDGPLPAAGVYFLRVRAGGLVQTRRVVVAP